MEKAWRVKIPIWNKNTSSKDRAEIHEFIVFQHTEKDARLEAAHKAAKLFPPRESWLGDANNITVQEISHAEISAMLEARRAEIAEQSGRRIDDALAEFESKTGIHLKKPE